ncbi:prophage tail fiber N-terminal domain-containing protein, partial [Serratia fonticola]|uniref:phage tail fiber protein n=1 Tax=Serratia fonticola TaxID=47917 RepID=UPI001FCEA3F4
MITAAGRQPERVGGIQVMVNSATGTLNDFLTIPGEADLNPAIVAAVDGMRAAAAASAAAKTSENNAAATLANAVKKGEFGIGGVTPPMPLVDTLNAVKSQMSGKYVAWAGSEGMPRTDTAYMLDWTLASASSGVVQGVVFATALITAPSSFDQVYRNVCRNGVFQGWKIMWDENSLINIIRGGDYGIGGDLLTYNNLSDTYRFNYKTGKKETTFFSFESTSVAATVTAGLTVPAWVGNNTWGFGLRIVRASSQPTQTVDLILSNNGRMGYRYYSNDKDYEFLTTGNTTFDANGFVKKASPIVKLFGTGESELNDQSQGVTTERVSEG